MNMKNVVLAGVLAVSAMALPYAVDAHAYQGSSYYKGNNYSRGFNRIGPVGDRASYDDGYEAAFKYVADGRKPRIPRGLARDNAYRAGWDAGVADGLDYVNYGGGKTLRNGY